MQMAAKFTPSGARGADGAGGVPVAVMAGLHRHADPAADLIARDDRAQQILHRGADRLRRGQCRADGGAGGVVAGIAVDVVEFDRVAGGGIDQRRLPQRHARAIHIADRLPRAALGSQRCGQQCCRRAGATGQKRCEPIQQRAARVMLDSRRQGHAAAAGGVIGQAQQRISHGVPPAALS
jgi:hypothetical protein